MAIQISPSFKAALRPILVTLLYWPFALFILGFLMLGDCLDPAACEANKRVILTVGFAIEVTIYGLLLHLMLRKRA